MIKEFEEKLHELTTLIGEQEEVIRYKQIEIQMESYEGIKEKIARLKKLQQKMAIEESKGTILSNEVTEAYDALLNELMDIPIFSEYITLQEEINDVIQEVTQIIQDEINK